MHPKNKIVLKCKHNQKDHKYPVTNWLVNRHPWSSACLMYPVVIHHSSVFRSLYSLILKSHEISAFPRSSIQRQTVKESNKADLAVCFAVRNKFLRSTHLCLKRVVQMVFGNKVILKYFRIMREYVTLNMLCLFLCLFICFCVWILVLGNANFILSRKKCFFQLELLSWTTLEIYFFSDFNETLTFLFSIHEEKTYSKHSA